MIVNFIRNFSQSEKKRVYSIINKILQNVNEKKWVCLTDNCDNTSINSHILQKNGVLSTIAYNNHIYTLSNNKSPDEKKAGKPILKKTGINEALVFPLFCNKHDLEIFKEIETGNYNPINYKQQLLFTYRSICCELHKKRVAIEYYKRIIESVTLGFYIEKENAITGKESHTLGLRDCEFYKSEIEKALQEKLKKTFHFQTFEYPLIKISASAAFTPVDNSYDYYDISPFKNVFISIIPFRNKIFVTAGYHIEYTNSWIKEYIESWKNLNRLQLEMKLSDLLATRTESFCLSPEIVEKMDPVSKNAFLNYWNENVFNLQRSQQFEFNIFNQQ